MVHEVPETKEQMHVVTWLRMMWPKVIFTISPSAFKFGGSSKQRMIQGKKMKDMGYLPGTPDIMIFHPVGEWHGLFIELKRPSGKAEPHQLVVLQSLSNVGYKVFICYGYNEATRVIQKYLTGQF